MDAYVWKGVRRQKINKSPIAFYGQLWPEKVKDSLRSGRWTDRVEGKPGVWKAR